VSGETNSPKVSPRTWATLGLLAFCWLSVGWCSVILMLAPGVPAGVIEKAVEGVLSWSLCLGLMAVSAWRIRKERSEFSWLLFYVTNVYASLAVLVAYATWAGSSPLSITNAIVGFRIVGIPVGLVVLALTSFRSEPGDAPEDPEERWRTPPDEPPSVP
jgi:hypothetical protein